MPSSVSSNESERGGIDLDERLDPLDEEAMQEEEEEEETYPEDEVDDEVEEDPQLYADEEEIPDPDEFYDETQGETQDEEEGGAADQDGDDEHDQDSMTVDADASIPAPKKKRGRPAGTAPKPKEQGAVKAVNRLPGKVAFPVSRVSKIIKADKDIPVVAKDAVFLISLATEEFIRRLVESGQRTASQGNRMTVQHTDIFAAIKRIDEFMFLEEMIPFLDIEIKKEQLRKKEDREKAAKEKAAKEKAAKANETPPKGGIKSFLPTTKQSAEPSDTNAKDDDVVMQDEA